jgi:hypothetical protein
MPRRVGFLFELVEGGLADARSHFPVNGFQRGPPRLFLFRFRGQRDDLAKADFLIASIASSLSFCAMLLV